MNRQSQVVALRTPEIINRESADWLAKMDGDNMSKADRVALKAWLNESDEHVVALKNHMSMWDEMTEVINDSSELFAAEHVKQGYFSWVKEYFSWKPMVLAMSCMFLLILSGVFIGPRWSVGNVETAFYVTKVGAQQTYQLSDGSTAFMNTDSRIEVEFSQGQRIVRLQQGEVLFDVAHDKARPFIVYAAGSAVRAVGTKFVVRLSAENILVTVTEGTVALSKRDNTAQESVVGTGLASNEKAPMLLDKGEQAEFIVEDAVFVTKDIAQGQVDEQLSWLDGQLVFKEEKLGNVINEINRYLDSDIVILNPELKDIPISGRFQVGETEALLEAIEITFDINVSKNKNQIYLSKYGSE
ncbi:MAG: FecR domain-containing protein [Colwellia sp.]|nr:FecR domain-containing protein [Colwellia sp.]MCW8863661.1 FecR domain-containing protein [Colwellia sp.]MCW9081518.1 FecR domain-containing protein [Colwellia sp.]